MFHSWTSTDGLIGIEIDADGVWLRRREHPANQWDPPELMLKAGGNGSINVSNAGIETKPL